MGVVIAGEVITGEVIAGVVIVVVIVAAATAAAAASPVVLAEVHRLVVGEHLLLRAGRDDRVVRQVVQAGVRRQDARRAEARQGRRAERRVGAGAEARGQRVAVGPRRPARTHATRQRHAKQSC